MVMKKQQEKAKKRAKKLKEYLLIDGTMFEKALVKSAIKYDEKAKKSKLKDLSVLRLQQNCGRAAWLKDQVGKENLPKDIYITSCFCSETCKGCFHNFTRAYFKDRFFDPSTPESVANLPKKLVDFSAFLKFIKYQSSSTKGTKISQKVKNYMNSPIKWFREGQAGDSSYLIKYMDFWDNVEEFLSLSNKEKIVLISAAYADNGPADYERIKKYSSFFVLHFSLSSWFTREELDHRINALAIAFSVLGPQVVKARIITNKDQLGGWNDNQLSYILDRIHAIGLSSAEVLETPFHDDMTKKHSKAYGTIGRVCCSTGHCNSCPVQCLTGCAAPINA